MPLGTSVSRISELSDNWLTGGEWSSGLPPTSVDNALIAALGMYTVTINSSVAAKSLTLNSANATVQDSGTLTLIDSLTQRRYHF